MSEVFEGAGADLFRIASEHELKGSVSKRPDKPYRSGRRDERRKTKCVQSDRVRLRSGRLRRRITSYLLPPDIIEVALRPLRGHNEKRAMLCSVDRGRRPG